MNIENYLMTSKEKQNFKKRELIAEDIKNNKTYDEIRAARHCSAATISLVKKIIEQEKGV